MMNKIRAAVVGAGIYGKHHMNAYRHNPDTVLVAILMRRAINAAIPAR